MVATLTDVPIKADRDKNLDFMTAISGAIAAITEDGIIRNNAHTADKNWGVRKQMLKQFRAFESWQRRQKKQKAKRAADKKTRQAAMFLAEKKARTSARAKAKAKAKVSPVVA